MNFNLHDLDIWGHKLKIMDFDGSSTPGYVERDMNEGTHACRDKFYSGSEITIVDLGANVGIWSIAMAKQYPKSTIIAVEPIPLSMDNLKRNCEMNGVTNVHPVQTAVFDKVSRIFIQQNPTNSGSASVFMSPGIYPEFEVDSTTLDELLKELPRVDLLKVDLEGCEYTVFRDFKAWNKLDFITMETHLLPLHPDKLTNAKQGMEIIENFYKFLCTKMPKERMCVQTPFYTYEWGEKKSLPEGYMDPDLSEMYPK